MIEATGVMSGGGQPKRGLMSSKIEEEFSDNQMKDIDQRITESERKLQGLKDELSKLEQQKA